MRQVLGYVVIVTNVTALVAFHGHGVHMMAKGFGNQSDRKQRPLSSKVVVPPPAPKSPDVGDLPDDAFSQFPPLTPEQQKSLVGARGGEKGLPEEVRPDISACTSCSSAAVGRSFPRPALYVLFVPLTSIRAFRVQIG